jgi:uncharacterized protein (UPF0332 family)
MDKQETFIETLKGIKVPQNYLHIKDNYINDILSKNINVNQLNDTDYKATVRIVKANIKYKIDRAKMIKDKLKSVRRLEVHAYAPELNKLHMNNGDTYRVPGITDIESALIKIFK